MPGQPVVASIQDAGLPSLAQALDSAAMLPHVAAALDIEVVDGLRCSAEVLSHKPGSRCTVRYTLERAGAPLARAAGKLYRDVAQAETAVRRMRELRAALRADEGAARIPEALSIVPELGLVLQSYVDAPDVRHALAAGEGARPAVAGAQFLARLHAAAPLPGLETMSIAHELEKAEQWRAQIERAVPSLGSPLRSLLAELRRLGASLPVTWGSMIHKDFYYAHVLWDGETVWVVDFDELQLGDPAFDAGHFLAHLANLSFRQTGRSDGYALDGRSFLESYLERAQEDVRDRVPFYQAYTFVKLAATDVTRKRDEWTARAALLTGLASRTLTGRA